MICLSKDIFITAHSINRFVGKITRLGFSLLLNGHYILAFLSILYLYIRSSQKLEIFKYCKNKEIIKHLQNFRKIEEI